MEKTGHSEQSQNADAYTAVQCRLAVRTVVFRVEDAAKEDLFTNITVCLSHLMPSCS